MKKKQTTETPAGTPKKKKKGLSVPSAQNIVELAQIFRVSTDTILGIEREYTLDISDLTPEQRKLVSELVQHFYTENNKDG